MVSTNRYTSKYFVILSERYSIRLLTLLATLPILDTVDLSFYASYSICQFICSLYLAGFQEVSRNLIGEQGGNISNFQKKYSIILAIITFCLIIIYVKFFARDFPILFLLAISPFLNLAGFKRTLAIESSGKITNLAVVRVGAVILGVTISYICLSSHSMYLLVTLSLLCDLFICLSVYVLKYSEASNIQYIEDPNFLQLSLRNILLGFKPIAERFGIMIIANSILSGIYSLSFQIISSYVGILIYSFNSLIQIQSKFNKIEEKLLDKGYLYLILISIISLPGIHYVGSILFDARWFAVSDFVAAILASKLIGIQNILTFNNFRKNFSTLKWTIFYCHIPFTSALISAGFYWGKDFALVCIVLSGILETWFYCGGNIFRNRNFLIRVSIIMLGIFSVRMVL